MAISDYEIIKEIGRGGMGAVYLARDPRLDRLVAIKKIKMSSSVSKDSNSEVVQRFYREARAVANLSHPNIVNVYELGEDPKTHECFMVMEYLKGKSLEKMLEEEKTITLNTVIKIAIQLADALFYLHRQNIMHRDIKPGNLIYREDGMVKLTDFGLVKSGGEDMELTRAGTLLGSVLYMSPEQIENPKDIDVKVDMYAFGVTMFQLLSGEFPYNGDSVWEVISKITRNEPLNLRKANPRIPEEIEKIVMKTIARKKEHRYESMQEVQQAFSHYNLLKVQTVVSPIGYANINVPSVKSTEPFENNSYSPSEGKENLAKEQELNEQKAENKLVTTTITAKSKDDDLSEVDLLSDTLVSTNLFTLKKENSEKTKVTVNLSEIDLLINSLFSVEETTEDFAFTDRTEKLNLIEKHNLSQYGNLEQNLKYLNKIFQEVQQGNRNLHSEIKDLTLEYNANIGNKTNQEANNYNLMMKEIKKKIDLKKMQRDSNNKELEFITKKFEINKLFFDSKGLRKKINALIIEIVSCLDYRSFFAENHSILKISESQAEETKNIIIKRLKNLQSIDLFVKECESLRKKLEGIKNIPDGSSHVSGLVIRFAANTQSVEAKLFDDFESGALIEFDLPDYQVFLVSCSIIHKNKPVHKSGSGSIVFFKSESFVEPLKNKFKTNTSIFKAKNRLYRKDILDNELRSYEDLISLLNLCKTLFRENLTVCFENISDLFAIEQEIDLNLSPESKQSAINKTNKIRKNLFDLKKELELFGEEISKEYNLQINTAVQAATKFPTVLKNHEKKMKIFLEQRKREVQSILTHISKSDYFILQNQRSKILEKIEALKIFEIPEAMEQLLKFYLLSKAQMPTEISKNQLLEKLNNDREKFIVHETDWICRLLNLRYNREKGFMMKVTL